MTGARVSDDLLRAFLVETLALWQIEARVEAAEFPLIACIHTADGTRVSIAKPATDVPFRWLVETARPSEGAVSAPRVRPCGSLVGVLGALRRSLGVERSSTIRVVPGPS
jgi:hypothetical protein